MWVQDLQSTLKEAGNWFINWMQTWEEKEQLTMEKYTQTHTLNTHPHELGPENTQGMQWDRWDL